MEGDVDLDWDVFDEGWRIDKTVYDGRHRSIRHSKKALISLIGRLTGVLQGDQRSIDWMTDWGYWLKRRLILWLAEGIDWKEETGRRDQHCRAEGIIEVIDWLIEGDWDLIGRRLKEGIGWGWLEEEVINWGYKD
jgi:hypothetical protein